MSDEGGAKEHEPHPRGSLYSDEIIATKVKAELRKRMRAVRRATPIASCEARSAKIRERILALPEVEKAATIALFFPIEGRNEVDLRPLDLVLGERGKTRVYPSIDPDTNRMTFRKVSDFSELDERGRGFLEPAYDAEEIVSPDVIVVPALAAAPSGHRLGYGAGYYDRALGAAKEAFSVIVIYDYQLLMEVPTLAHDVACRYVVTDARGLAADPVVT